MLGIFLVVCTVSLLVSFFCSLSEAALYAVPEGLVRHLAKGEDPRAIKLERLKKEMGKLIAAILILNTLANTAGAAIAGAQAGILWGEEGIIGFSIFFTIMVLLGGEIVPKTLGIAYSKPIALAVASPWSGFIRVLGPLVNLAERAAQRFGSQDSRQISPEEILSLAQLGTEAGTLDAFESEVISNVMELDDTLVRDILTPRMSVFMLSETTFINEISDQLFEWKFSRIPIYSESDQDHITGYVMHRDMVKAILAGNLSTCIKELKRPIPILPELTTVDRVLAYMLKNQEHICALVDEHGSLAGIVTLEDILEEIVGTEIEDELDTIRIKN